MKILRRLKNQAGFTLVQAVFIVVVLALLGTLMLRLSGVQSSTSVFALQGAKAYQAARSGLEWGATRASLGQPCNGTVTVGSFSVAVSCNTQTFTEGTAAPYQVYRFSSIATFASVGSPDYIRRELESKVRF